MAAAFVSHSTGAASRSVTVPAGSLRLLVVVSLGSSAFSSPRTVTYGGVTCSTASDTNDFVQIHYMLNPTVGAATLSVSGTGLSTVLAAHYTGIGSFQTASEASAASITLNPTGAAVMVVGMSASTTSHTPLASTNERADAVGNWYGDRIVTGSGSITVGVSSATDPDSAGAVFLEPPIVSASGTPAAPRANATGSAAVVVSASGSAAAPIPTASGSVTVVPTNPTASGSVVALSPTASGAADVELTVSGAVTALSATASGSVTVEVSTSGTVTALRPTASGSVTAVVNVSGSVTAPLPTAFGTNAEPGRFVARTTISEAHSAALVVDPIGRSRTGRPRTSATED